MKKVALLINICFGWISVSLGQTCPIAGNADINPTATTICPGTSVTFSLEGPYFGGGAGSTITYAWYINGSYVSSAADSYTTSALNNGDRVYCIISATKSGCSTARVTTSTVTETVLQPAFTTPSGSTTVCPGSSTAYTTSGVNFTSYNWALSPLSAGTVSGNTTSATVQWASGYSGAATLSISSSNSTCSTNSSSSASLTVRALATTPTAIGGPGTICQESADTYSTTASNADIFYWSISSSTGTTAVGTGTASTSIVFPTGVSGPATLSVYAVGCNTTPPVTMPVDITPTVAASSPPAGAAQLCQGSAPTVYTTGTASNATGYVWSISPSSAGTVSGSGTSGTVIWNNGFSGAATLSVQASGCNAPAAATSTVNIVGPLGTIGAISGSSSVANSNVGGVTSTYSVAAANALSYAWSLTPGEAGTISGTGGTATITWNAMFSGNAVVGVTATGCSSSATATPLTVAVTLPLTVGNITSGALTIASGTSPGQLMVTSAAGGSCGMSYTYSWQSSPDNTTWTTVGTGSTYTPAALSSNTYYQVVVSCNGQTATTNSAEIVVGTVSSDWSYVRTRDIVRPGITDMTTANGLTDPADVKQVTEYLDGLGRPIQEVAMKASPAENDMVSMHVYDAFDREPLKYLPYTSPSNDGNFKTDPYSEQQTFNAAQFPGEQFFGSETVYEASPLNRPLTTYAPGSSWAGGGRGVGTAYLVNTSNDSVVLWTIASAPGSVPVSQGNYAAGTLYVTPTTDENGHQVIEYKDEQGKTLLKKVKLWDAPAAGPSGWLNTYYVYDTLENLRYVVSPKAVDWLKVNGWSFAASGGQAVDSELCFRYEYDYRQRMIIKKVPGAGETWMVYDVRDRLVMTEDANLRQAGQWLVTQYDGLNRPVETGLINYASTLANLQGIVTNETANGGSTVAEPVDTTISGANTTGDIRAAHSITGENGFSTADDGTFIGEIVNGNWGSGVSTSNSNNISLSPVPSGVILQPLTVTYYDDYDWVSGSGTGLPSTFASMAGKTNYFIASYNMGPVNAVPVTPLLVTRGEVTGTQTLVLGSNGQYLSSINFYDDRARLIQTQAINYTGGLDTVTTQYDFSGKPLRSLVSQAKRTNTAQYHEVLTKTNYDAGFRVTSIWKNIDGAASDQLIDSMQYNELGQLSTKSLGKDPTTGQPLDNLVYDYNVRGWVTGINKAYVAGTAQHYFGMELGYDNATSVAGTSYSTPAYNGNIAGTIWKSAGDGVNRKYDFSYDDVNRLTGAAYLDNHSGTGWDTSAMNYSVSGLTYDDNGNILSMIQKGFKIGNPTGIIDSLTYTYTANSNKLLQVHDEFNDTASVLGDFHYKGVKQAYDYSYDANGSLNLDNNKGIDTIVYNYLNLPQRVHMKGKGNIMYTYDASGEKLSKQTIDSAAGLATTTLYMDGFQYQRRTTITNTTGGVDTLQFVGHEEGRARWAFQNLGNGDSAYSWQYDFYERDHLGNTRIVLTQEKETDQYPAATMEVSDSALENLYYTNLDETRSSLPAGYPTDTTTNPNQYVSQLAGFGSAPQIGPGIVLKVMAGDHFSIRTSSWWRTGPPTPQQVPGVASDLVSALIAGMSHVPGEGATAGAMSNSPTLTPSMLDFLADTGKIAIDQTRPHAFLNWILFDNQFNYVAASSGALQVGVAGPIDKMTVTDLPVTSSGFLYIYVNNASPNVPVFFDNLQVTHVRGPLLEENHYYPFGLTMAGISDKAIKSQYAQNKYRYNGKELQNQEFADGSGLEEYDYGARFQDPQLGVWHGVDPMTDSNRRLSPYTYGVDNPIRFIDPDGMTTYEYGDPCITCSDFDPNDNKLVNYFTVKDKSGDEQTYITGYAAKGAKEFSVYDPDIETKVKTAINGGDYPGAVNLVTNFWKDDFALKQGQIWEKHFYNGENFDTYVTATNEGGLKGITSFGKDQFDQFADPDPTEAPETFGTLVRNILHEHQHIEDGYQDKSNGGHMSDAEYEFRGMYAGFLNTHLPEYSELWGKSYFSLTMRYWSSIPASDKTPTLNSMYNHFINTQKSKYGSSRQKNNE